MIRRTMLLVTLLAFLNCVLGCTSQTVIPKDELLETRRGRGKIIDARLRSMEIVHFNDEGGTLDTIAGTVTGVTREGTPVELNCDDIDRFCIHQRCVSGKTILTFVGVVALVAIVLALVVEDMDWDWEIGL